MTPINNLALETIKSELCQRGIGLKKVILFGSRAKGDAVPDSDWDFLVVIDREIEPRAKRELIGEIKVRLAEQKIPNDLFIQSAAQLETQKNDVGLITYYALKYGVELSL